MNFIFMHLQEQVIQWFSPYMPLIVESLCLLFKLTILYALCRSVSFSNKNKMLWYLVLILLTGVLTNINLIFLSLANHPFGVIPHLISRTMRRFEYATFLLQCSVFLYLFRDLSSRKINRVYVDAMVIFSFMFTIVYVLWGGYAFVKGYEYSRQFDFIVSPFGNAVALINYLYVLGIIGRNILKERLKLVREHNFTLGLHFMLPYFLVKVLESDFFSPMAGKDALILTALDVHKHVLIGSITSSLLTYMVYYCARKLILLRFLNVHKHVISTKTQRFSFMNDFKYVLGQLGAVAHNKDIARVTVEFFERAFGVPAQNISMFFRQSKANEKSSNEGNSGQSALIIDERHLFIEKILNSHSRFDGVRTFIDVNRIIICDEVEFSHHSGQKNVDGSDLVPVVEFMKRIHADVFVPVYLGSKIVAFIIIDHGVRPKDFYTDLERDEMLIYCDYVSSVIYLINNVNLDVLLTHQTRLETQLGAAHSRLQMLRNSVEYFFEASKTRKIGVLTYKNKRFTYINQTARDLLQADLNKDKGLEITQKLQEIGHHVSLFFSPRRAIVRNVGGQTLVVNASTNVEKNNTVMTVSNITITDLLKDKRTMLQDKNKWDMLLALQTTQAGAMINRLLPADTRTLLNCKVLFLEHALMQGRFLLEVSSDEDARTFAQVIHAINHRKIFEEVVIHRLANDDDLYMKLFGVNVLFQKQQAPCSFETLHKKGTLFIRNVHLLSFRLQKRLLEYLTSGTFTPLSSDERIPADVLIIATTNQNLLDLTERGLFLKDLYLELHKGGIWLPSLNSLPEEEFLALAEGIREQLVYAKMYKNLLEFNDADKKRLISYGCVSLEELKTKIQSIIVKKTQRQSIRDTQVIDPAYKVHDVELMEAARLGRYALKDPKMLQMLMTKFEYSQSKVAQFLGVNRSTVSRRCMQYDIQEPSSSASGS